LYLSGTDPQEAPLPPVFPTPPGPSELLSSLHAVPMLTLSPPPPPMLSQSGRLLRDRHLPARFQDIYPEPPHPVASAISLDPPSSVSTPTETAVNRCMVRLIVRNWFQTSMNVFGLWKDYRYRPSQDPNAFILPEDLYRPIASTNTTIVPEHETEVSSPYKNNSVKLVIDWQNTSSLAKSNKELDHLVRDVLHHPDFRLDELEHFNAGHENRKADAAEENSPFLQSFTHATISIDVPSDRKHSAPLPFSIPGLYFHKITILIQEAFQSPLSRHFHLSPFNLYQKHPNGKDNEWVFSELYDSDVLLHSNPTPTFSHTAPSIYTPTYETPDT